MKSFKKGNLTRRKFLTITAAVGLTHFQLLNFKDAIANDNLDDCSDPKLKDICAPSEGNTDACVPLGDKDECNPRGADVCSYKHNGDLCDGHPDGIDLCVSDGFGNEPDVCHPPHDKDKCNRLNLDDKDECKPPDDKDICEPMSKEEHEACTPPDVEDKCDPSKDDEDLCNPPDTEDEPDVCTQNEPDACNPQDDNEQCDPPDSPDNPGCNPPDSPDDPGCNPPNDPSDSNTLVTLLYFTATARGRKVILEWETASEIDNAGFHILRATGEGWRNGDYSTVIRITRQQLIPAKGDGSYYSYVDSNVERGVTYYYALIDVELCGKRTIHRDFIDSVMVR